MSAKHEFLLCCLMHVGIWNTTQVAGWLLGFVGPVLNVSID